MPRLASVHLLGAAVGARGDWRSLDAAVQEGVWSYRSTHDRVLESYSGPSRGNSRRCGLAGFRSAFLLKLPDRHVPRRVSGHSEYTGWVTLAF